MYLTQVAIQENITAETLSSHAVPGFGAGGVV